MSETEQPSTIVTNTLINNEPSYSVNLSRSVSGVVYWDIIVKNEKTWQQAVSITKQMDCDLSASYPRIIVTQKIIKR